MIPIVSSFNQKQMLHSNTQYTKNQQSNKWYVKAAAAENSPNGNPHYCFYFI